jgi:hypothetical protein
LRQESNLQNHLALDQVAFPVCVLNQFDLEMIYAIENQQLATCPRLLNPSAHQPPLQYSCRLVR